MRRSTSVFWSLLALGVAIGWMACSASAAEVTGAEPEAPAKEKKVDPSGSWRWEYEREGQTVKSMLRLRRRGDKLTGVYRRDERRVKLEECKLEGDTLTCGFKFDADGREVTLKFQGKVGEDTIKGTVSVASGDWSREFDWEAKRSVELADILGTWKFQIKVGEDRVIEPSIKLSRDRKKLKGVYTSPMGEVEAKEVKLENNTLTFQIAGEYEDRKFTVTYKGKPRGRRISGTIDYDFDGNTGSTEFQGERLREKKKKKEKKAE